MKENSQAYLATEKIGVLMRKYSLPCIISLLVGALYNIVDQIFIANADYLGSYGNAANTVVFPLTVILTILYLCKPHILKLTKHDFGLKWNVIRRMLPLGICSFLSQISLVAAMAAINNMIRKYGSLDPIFGQAQYAQIPMAVVGIVMKFFQIVISIVVGMAAGCIPIVGYNMGAGIYQRVKKLFTCLLISEACVGAVALILVEGFPQALIGRRCQRKCILYGLCDQVLPNLSLYDHSGLYQQSGVYLPAGHGQGDGFYDAFHGERDCFWRWFCIVTAHPFWPGRRIIFHAGIRCADGGYIGSSDCKDI